MEATCAITNTEPATLLEPYARHFFPPAKSIFLDASQADAEKPKSKAKAKLPTKLPYPRKAPVAGTVDLPPEKTFRSRKAGHPMIGFTMIPHPFGYEGANEFIKGSEIDSWDFVLRNTFVQAKTPIKKALS